MTRDELGKIAYMAYFWEGEDNGVWEWLGDHVRESWRKVGEAVSLSMIEAMKLLIEENERLRKENHELRARRHRWVGHDEV